MTDIHPNIRKFWERAGHGVFNATISLTGERVWLIDDRGTSYLTIAYIPQGTDEIRYYIDGQEYEEKTALRVIKLTVFL